MQPLTLGKFDRCKYLGIALLSLLAYQMAAYAQQPSRIPDIELAIPGVAQQLDANTPAIDASAYPDLSRAEALAKHFKEAIPHTRGAQDILLFRQAAPSVREQVNRITLCVTGHLFRVNSSYA